jgi:DNA-binding PucR family transcriptional regulator
VLTLNRGGSKAPWLLNTLTALSTTDSLRSAATALVVHHSSLQKRLTQIEKLIGWDVTTPAGKFRLQIALILRRLDLTRP